MEAEEIAIVNQSENGEQQEADVVQRPRSNQRGPTAIKTMSRKPNSEVLCAWRVVDKLEDGALDKVGPVGRVRRVSKQRTKYASVQY
jgi:hypothetical protein